MLAIVQKMLLQDMLVNDIIYNVGRDFEWKLTK